MMKVGAMLHDKSLSASKARAKFGVKSYSISDNYPKRIRSIVADAKLDTIRNQELFEELRCTSGDLSQLNLTTSSSFAPLDEASKFSSLSNFPKQNLILVGRDSGQQKASVTIAPDALPRLLTRAASIIGSDQDSLAEQDRVVGGQSLAQFADFPQNIKQLDFCNHLLIKYEPELDPRHPGFHDSEYRERRKAIAELAFQYKYGDAIPDVSYTKEEHVTWKFIYQKLKISYNKYACKQHNRGLALLEQSGIYSENCIPQLKTVSEFLKSKTGWQLRPTAGLLTARDFLASLAFRVFQTTQYIRHHGNPEHSVEPDCIHELMGHVPMLLDESFANFSHEIGLASLGASDSQIEKFATLYWFTVEFGLCFDEIYENFGGLNSPSNITTLDSNNDGPNKFVFGKRDSLSQRKNVLKCYGAGLLSSYGEMKNALESTLPTLKYFDAEKTAVEPYDDSEYQTTYFIAESFDNAREKVREYARKHLHRPFELNYNSYTSSIQIIDSLSKLECLTVEFEEKMSKLVSATKKLASRENTKHPHNISFSKTS